VDGDLSADGTGTGSGGSITISVTSSTPFSIGAGNSLSGVAGVIHANAPGTPRDGGTIRITQHGSGGILFCAAPGNPLISARTDVGFGNGQGGTITINTGSGGLINDSGAGGAQLVADGRCGDAGTVTLNMASLTNLPGAGQISIVARGFDGGAGGTVNLALTSQCQDLVIGDGD